MIKVTAVGRLVKDAEVFNYGEEKTGVSFSLACNDGFNEEPTYIKCVFFNRNNNLAKHLNMGNQIIVFGELKINIEEKENQVYRYTEIIISDLEFGSKKQK